jgi:Carboxypeptidase regulatory-like domain
MRRLLVSVLAPAVLHCSACNEKPPPVRQTGTPGRIGTAMIHGVTGTDGNYAITGLPPGTYVLEAWQEAGGKIAEPVTVKDGAAVTVDLTFG